MKKSPFQLQQPEFPTIEIRAHHIDQSRVGEELPVAVDGLVTYDIDGNHFAALTIMQASEEYAYSFKIQLFSVFRLDIELAKETYGKGINPGVIAVNIARILYSGAREMLAVVSSRGPYGPALLPTLLIEPPDVSLEFGEGKHKEILAKHFGYDPEAIQEIDRSFREKANSAPGKQLKKAKSKKKSGLDK